MTDENLTRAEKRYLNDLNAVPKTMRSRLLMWAFEVTPGSCMFGYGLFADSKLFLVMGFLSILYFALWRMYSQFRGFKMIHGIYSKRLKAGSDSDV